MIVHILMAMVIFEAIAMYTLKMYDISSKHIYLIVGATLYFVIAFLFSKAMHYSSLAIVNTSWNVFSSIISLVISIYLLGEHVSNINKCGILISIFGLFLMDGK